MTSLSFLVNLLLTTHCVKDAGCSLSIFVSIQYMIYNRLIEIVDGLLLPMQRSNNANRCTIEDSHLNGRWCAYEKGSYSPDWGSVGFKSCFLPREFCLSGKQLNGNKPCSSLMILAVAKHHWGPVSWHTAPWLDLSVEMECWLRFQTWTWTCF